MCFYIRNVMNYGSIEDSGMIPINTPKSKLENEKSEKALAKEREREEKAALKKAKKLKKEAEAQAKKRKNNQLLSDSPSKTKHIKITNSESKEKSIHKLSKTEKSLSKISSNGGKTLPKIKKDYISNSIISDDDDEETYTVLASGKGSYTSEVIGSGYSNGSIHKSTGGKVKPGSISRSNSHHGYGAPGNGQKLINSKQKKSSIDGSKNKSNDTNHNKNLLDSLLTDDDDEDLDEISSLTSISSSADEEVVIMASDHI
ncbi:hypothetical protein BCR36DRAFT_140045 [Piromyces finnis]|uniref:Uncharacterized protein n=1 Tax=Piromyces finnis TaxID=1754191 RepID=A0A1Y1V149_9FUNG|nr:hypothetical protein BCR36DRAFT_140045 [Piromyces finnis]|eukprot:ORX43748.1 hypothetical protein BCR36DRAFT_140045 [Piromyces finnis]